MGFRLHRTRQLHSTKQVNNTMQLQRKQLRGKHFQAGICRRLLGTTLAAFILFGNISEATKLVTYASELDGDTLIDPDQEQGGDETVSAENENTGSGVSAPSVTAESAILMDARSGAILY